MTTDSLQHPIVLYDGKCGFCKRHVERWKALSGEAIEYLPFQEHADQFPLVTKEQLGQAVHLLEPDGTITRGAEAVFRIAALSHQRPWLLWSYDSFPGFAAISEGVYSWIASHRDLFDPIDRALFGKSTAPTSHRLTISFFLRALGVMYLIAFWSLWVQIHGLVGSNGILPVAPALEAAKHQLNWSTLFNVPTLCWMSASDGFLTFLCAGGVVMSLLLIAGVLPFLMLIGLWAFYLSLVVVGQDFLSFQWDALLLEAGFASLFLGTFQFWMNSRTMHEPSHIGIWLLRWLAFRIMFLSGMTKLVAGDMTWRDGTALNYHYWTQPLPPWTAWYMNRAPMWFTKFSCWTMFFAELVIPFFVFMPRIPRRIAFFGIVLFQFTILLTGNYGFFNILTMVLCIPLLEDAIFPRRWKRKPIVYRRQPWWIPPLFAVPAVAIVLITCVAFARECEWEIKFPAFMQSMFIKSFPFRSANGYGLFRVMTKQRYEIVIEGSDDGEHWKIYEFKYKPGDVNRRPEFITPHMPRLDWQMWFAALDPQPPQWFMAFLTRLLEGSPQVNELLKTNPFPDHPPRYVHALLYDYHFADDPNGRAWWNRTLLGEYVPSVQLR
jgi:predicted DCC family thiol-disulfide oxidoreductase YuxK